MTRTSAALFSVENLLLAGGPGSPGSREDSEGEVGIAGGDHLSVDVLTPSNLAVLQASSTIGNLHPRCRGRTAGAVVQTNAVAILSRR